MDWIQFPFEVDARLHDGPGAPIVRLRWVYTDQPFLPVGTQSVINNRIWNHDQASDLPVGQFPPVVARFKQDARWALPAGLQAGHLCHPEWFAVGEPWPNDLPPAAYGHSGIPECCGLFQDVTQGGVEFGGESGDVFIGADPSEGGVEIGGSAGDEVEHRDGAEGGVEIGGSAGDDVEHRDGAEGGVEIGGSAGDDVEHRDGAEGGVEIGGSAGDEYEAPQPDPGLSCAGAPTVDRSRTYSYSQDAGLFGSHWFRFTLPSTGTWHIETTGLPGLGTVLVNYANGSCPAPDGLTPTTSGPPRWSWNGTAGDVIRMEFVNVSGIPNPYTFVWDSGA